MCLRTFFGIFALASIAACTASEREGVESADSNLIGGTELKDGDLPSTLSVNRSCTGTKVGARHILLAAHCVYGDGVSELYGDGVQVEVSAAVRQTEDSARQTLTIKHTHVAAEWINRCRGHDDTCRADLEQRPPDVALIETVEEIKDVPIAAIDTEPLAPGEAVIVAGFGCESAFGGYWQSNWSRLKGGVARLLPPSALLYPGSPVTDKAAPIVAAHDLITPGPAWPTPGPGLCPGDSGGALYRAKGGGATLVGVNSFVTVSGPYTARGQLSFTNCHTRLDTATPGNIGAWLASLGATTCSGASCPTRTPAAAVSTAPPMPEPSADVATHGRDLQCQQSITRLSRVEVELDRALGGQGLATVCISLDGHRVSAANETYRYVSVASCAPIDGRPLTAADEAKLPAGFTYRDGLIVSGPVETPPCDSFPTGDAGCRATLASPESLVSDVKRAAGKKSTCTVETPQLEDGAYAAHFSCVLEQGFASDVAAAPSVVAMFRLGHTDVDYDVQQKSLHGVAHSIGCDVFR